MSNDIIARLRLNAEQFSADSKSVFSAFNRDAISSGQQIKTAFEANFAQVQSIVRDALKMPSTDTGSLNLNVSGAQQAATQARQEAVALREVATAAERAAMAIGDTSEETRLFVTAARSAATEAEANATDIGRQAIALERLQAELNKSVSGVNRLTVANDQAAHSSASHRAGVQDLGFQISDFGTQVLGGTSPIRAFAQQSGQAAFALSQMEGGAGKVGTFLSGPWGAAILIGISALGEFLPAILQSTSALKDQADALDKAAQGADSFGNAQSLIAKVLDTATGKLKTHNEVLIQYVKLQAQANILAAQAAQKDAVKALSGVGQPGFLDSFLASAGAAGGSVGSIQSGDTAQATMRAQAASLKPLQDLINQFSTVANNPASSSAQIGKALDVAIAGVDALAAQSKLAGKNVVDVKKALLDLGTSRNDQAANQEVVDALNGKGISSDLVPYAKPKTPKRPKKAPETDGLVNSVSNDIASYTSQFRGDPTYIEKADAALRKLDQDAAALEKRKPYLDPAKYRELVAGIAATKQVIEDNLGKPFADYLKQQDRALAVQKLQLAGRDVEAVALQKSFSLADQIGHLDEAKLKIVYERADQEERISRALEAQRREIGLYVSAVGQVQSTVNQFLTDLGSKPGSAFKGLITGLVSDLRSLQRNLLSNQLFGGIEQDISDFVKGRTGPQAAIDYLKTQAQSVGDELQDLASTLSNVNGRIAGGSTGSLGIEAAAPKIALDTTALSDALASSAADFTKGDGSADGENSEIVVTARKVTDAVTANTAAHVTATATLNRIGSDLFSNIEKTFGITLPKALKDGLGTFLQGASTGVFAGGAFSAITGGKQSVLGSAIGGGLGKLAGGALQDTVKNGLSGLLGAGLSKTLGAAVPVIGSIAGGILGNVLGGLFQKKIVGAATINTGANGELTTTTSGNSKKAEAAATSEANSVISGIQQVAQALGAQITGASGITVGTYKGKYRVNTQGTKLGGSSSPVAGLTDFGDDQDAAIAYAVQAAISKGVITGISQASVKILQSGQDLQTAISKALLVEQVPKDLKAIVDPVGEAIDELNAKFNQTVAALKEGGATTDQMAQAQQLYNLELEQVKANTASASQTLKDFLKTLNIGSASPLSLRDQEASAKAVLQPFLTDIAAGKTINQSGYQDAAQAYLDVERQLYGSTERYFAAFDQIQAATAVAISKIDNVTSIASPASAADPFSSQTATATQTTATNTQTANEILSQQTDLLKEIRSLLSSGSGSGSGFATAARLFTSAAA